MNYAIRKAVLAIKAFGKNWERKKGTACNKLSKQISKKKR